MANTMERTRRSREVELPERRSRRTQEPEPVETSVVRTKRAYNRRQPVEPVVPEVTQTRRGRKPAERPVAQTDTPQLTMRPKKAAEVLSTLAGKVKLGEFRGRTVRPDVVLTRTELEAIMLGSRIMQNGVHKN